MDALLEAEPKLPPAAPPQARSRWRFWLTSLILLALVPWPAMWLSQLYLQGNFHEVLEGRLYRGAQPSPKELERLIDRYKFRTVLNLRGCCYPEPWYVQQAAVCDRRGVNLEDITFSAVHLPSRHELRKLVEILDRAETPILVHCRHGADRTGLAAMVARLLLDEYSYDSARRQLGISFGHLSVGKTIELDHFIQGYTDWLAASNQEHAPQRFRHWLLNEYRGADCDAQFEKVERRFETPRVRKALPYDIIVRNTGNKPWHFRALRSAGHHVTFKLVDDHNTIIHEGRAGMLDRDVPPGERIQVRLIIPPQAKSGRYRLVIDMIEEGHCWFYQTGSEPWEEELVIRE